MAKRFTDTDKWKKKWFRELGSRLRDIRQFVLDDCDHAGMWDLDLDRVSYHTRETVTVEDLKKAFNGEIEFLIGGDSIHIPAFIEFQYGTLMETNNAHKSVLKRLRAKKIEPLMSPSRGDQDKDQDQDQEKDMEKDKEMNLKKQILDAADIWGQTLWKYKIKKDPMLDQLDLGRLIQIHGFDKTLLALLGAGQEEKSEGYDPAKHVSIRRLFKPDIFDKFVNLGAQGKFKQEERLLITKPFEPLPDIQPTDPTEVAKLLGRFSMKSIPKSQTTN